MHEELVNRYELDSNRPLLGQLEDHKERLREYIQKVYKMKAGARKLYDATNDRRSQDKANSLMKEYNLQLQDLRQEFEELDTNILLVKQYDDHGRKFFVQTLSSLKELFKLALQATSCID